MKKLTFILCLAIAGFSLNSCTEDFEELNTDPGSLIADNVDASLLGQAFARSQYHARYGQNWRYQIGQNLFADLYSQYFATTASNFDSDRYVEVGRWIDLGWSSFYTEAAPNIKFVEDLTAENGLTAQNAAAKIWRVYGYHRVTDYWGPVIYSEFGNGETSVAYDSQEDIYRDFFTTLDEAVSVLKANPDASIFGSNDQIYGGDATRWLTFANSLRLRLALRVRYADPGLAQAEAEKAIADGVMTGNDENAYLSTTANSQNPFTTITNWGEFRMSALMESILEGYEDPRLPDYFNPSESGDSDGDGSPYEGLRNGQAKVDKVPALNSDNSDMETKWLPLGKGGTNPPMRIMSAAEVYFLRAEGALAGWNMGGTPKELYEMGITMSMKERIDAPDDAIAEYIASTNTPVGTGDAFDTQASTDIPVAFEEGGGEERQLEQIITQKWIALYPDGWEAFSELRRTGYPRIIPLLNSENTAVGTDEIFRRMTFVESEFSNNAEATEAAVSLLEGPNNNATRVWWDKKPQ